MNKFTNTTKHVLNQSPRNQRDNFEGGMSEVATGALGNSVESKFIDNSIVLARDNSNFMKIVTSS